MKNRYRASLILCAVLALSALQAAASPARTASDAQKRRRATPAAPRSTPKPRESETTQEVFYTCPMHHDVHSKTAGACPKCGMELEVEERGAKTKSE